MTSSGVNCPTRGVGLTVPLGGRAVERYHSPARARKDAYLHERMAAEAEASVPPPLPAPAPAVAEVPAADCRSRARMCAVTFDPKDDRTA